MPERRYRRFYRWNSFLLASTLASVTLALNMLSAFNVIELNPKVFHFHQHLAPLPTHVQDNVMAWGGLAVLALTILFNLLSSMFAYWKCSCVHGLQTPLNNLVSVTVSWIKPRLCCCNNDGENDTADAIEMDDLVKINLNKDSGAKEVGLMCDNQHKNTLNLK